MRVLHVFETYSRGHYTHGATGHTSRSFLPALAVFHTRETTFEASGQTEL